MIFLYPSNISASEAVHQTYKIDGKKFESTKSIGSSVFTKRHTIKHFWVKMKLLEAFIVSLFCTISFAFHVLNDNMLTSEPLLQYVPVGLLHANLSEMGAQRKVVLIQHLKNRNAAKLRQVFKLLLAKPNQKAAKYQPKSEQKSQNKNRSRFNRFRKYHGN